MKRLVWTENAVLSIRLREGLHTLAQMRNTTMQFFSVRAAKDDWAGIDLNDFEPLFFNFVANATRGLYDHRLPKGSYTPSAAPIPRHMLNDVGGRNLWDPAPTRFGYDLVELPPDNELYPTTLVKKDLTITDDLDLLHHHEDIGMQTSPVMLRDRLIRYFDTGINFDDSKLVYMPDLPLPAPQIDPADIPVWQPR